MKKLTILAAVLLICNVSSFSQIGPVYNWFKIPSGTANNLNFGNFNFIVGSGGTLLRTTNAGLNWSLVNTGSSAELRSVQNSNPNVIIVGNNGLILRSTNDGSSWNTISSGTSNNLNSLARLGSPIYVACGNGGTIIYSTNTGASWSMLSSGTTAQLNSVAGASPVIAVGSNGTITRSTNLGAAWNTVTSGVSQNLNGVDVISGLAVAVGQGGTIIRSTDGGATWQQVTSGTAADLNSIDILSPSGIFAAGNGVVIKSTDSGITWSVISDSRLPNLSWSSIYAYNLNEIYITGPSGNIYRKKFDSLYMNFYVFDPNNIKTRIFNSGIFNQIRGLSNTAGFEWPINSGKTAIFTTGLTTAAYVSGNLRMAAASYTGELLPGFCVNGNYQYDSRFKLYKVDADRPNDSDWNNWGLMVPFGAPFNDLNNNGIYEPNIDKPGVKGAKQTIYVCMTDANPVSHISGEGFGGGTTPLGAEYHLTAWGYDNAPYRDMIFFKWTVINKSQNAWDSTIFSIVSDPDLGWSDDDYIGCDTARNLSYCYNADNFDGTGQQWAYGENPPATGIMFLNCTGGNSVLTSMTYFTNSSPPGPVCERDPSTPLEAYNFMNGFKKDRTPWVNITNSQTTKFCYSGDPETNSGWTEFRGRVENCGGSLTGNQTIPVPAGDRRQLLNYKPQVVKINPGDSQVILTAQLIGRGTNYTNSVTVLKQLSDAAKDLCQNGFIIGIEPVSNEVPKTYDLFQNYPNPFNPVTKIRFALPKQENVLLKIYDAIGREVAVLVNEKLNAGEYSASWDASGFPSGIYFFRFESGTYTETKKMALVK